VNTRKNGFNFVQRVDSWEKDTGEIRGNLNMRKEDRRDLIPKPQ
jgi:hypothetical protein